MNKFILLVVAAVHASASAATSGNRQCPGGYAHGSQMDVGRYWYECVDGQVKPKGCLTDDGRRVDLDSTYDTTDYRMQCVLGSDGYLTVVYKACMFQSAEHDVDSQWDDGKATYNCVREGNNVRVHMLGCVDQGRTMKFEERVAKGEFIYQCKKSTDGSPKMNKVGCIHEGRKYNIGETYEGTEVWYTCTDSGSKVVGCMSETHRLQDGDYFTSDNMMYSCKVTQSGAHFEPFACMAKADSGNLVERRVGCFWVEGDFEYTCKVGSDNKMARVQTQCFYRGQQGGYFKIRPGCVQLADDLAVGCRESGSGTLRAETFPADQIDRLSGLRKC